MKTKPNQTKHPTPPPLLPSIRTKKNIPPSREQNRASPLTLLYYTVVRNRTLRVWHHGRSMPASTHSSTSSSRNNQPRQNYFRTACKKRPFSLRNVRTFKCEPAPRSRPHNRLRGSKLAAAPKGPVNFQKPGFDPFSWKKRRLARGCGVRKASANESSENLGQRHLQSGGTRAHCVSVVNRKSCAEKRYATKTGCRHTSRVCVMQRVNSSLPTKLYYEYKTTVPV